MFQNVVRWLLDTYSTKAINCFSNYIKMHLNSPSTSLLQLLHQYS